MPHIAHVDSQGNRLPSVTELKSILKQPFLERWWRSQCRCAQCGLDQDGQPKPDADGRCGFVRCDQIGHAARDIGSNVHEAIENHLKGLESPDLTEQEKFLFERVRCFIDQSGFKPVHVEKQITSDGARLGGTVDAIGTFDKKFWTDDKKFWGSLTKGEYYPTGLWICDWKVANQLDELSPLQGCGYRHLMLAEHDVEINNFVIVRIDKDPKARVPVEVKGYWLPDYINEFAGTKHLWDLVNKEGRWAALRKRARKA
jgi:hypothetical protein